MDMQLALIRLMRHHDFAIERRVRGVMQAPTAEEAVRRKARLSVLIDIANLEQAAVEDRIQRQLHHVELQRARAESKRNRPPRGDRNGNRSPSGRRGTW